MVSFSSSQDDYSPESVRNVLLDFPKIGERHTGFVKSITPLDTADSLAVGKTLHCVMKDFEFEAIITENSPSKFAWQKPPIMTISGLHSFFIEPSERNPGDTIFTQIEE
ncbi:hypothetical protein BPOR_0224g00060 [Botrytis porri]|uniref:Uncharacterized protein n=1 Tax=Botrytis porri TaxID=87229 RepID=A0A4Z1KMY0_9HELO|nr:hypothetical protein BPOR_0224g00060 [Botrytis porri]